MDNAALFPFINNANQLINQLPFNYKWLIVAVVIFAAFIIYQGMDAIIRIAVSVVMVKLVNLIIYYYLK